MSELLPILARLRQQSRNNTRVLQDLKSALEAGADPNAVGENGRTALGFLASWDKCTTARGRYAAPFNQAAQLLGRFGADPLLPGCVFFQRVDQHISHGLIIGLSHDVGSRSGKPRLLHDGSSPLHGLLASFCYSRPGIVNETIKLAPQWASVHRQSDGATPLHVQWHPDLIDDLIQKTPPGSVSRQASADTWWECTKYLVGAGASLQAQDKDGNTPADYIVHALDHGWPVGQGLEQEFRQILALAQKARMDRLTPTAPSGLHKRRL